MAYYIVYFYDHEWLINGARGNTLPEAPAVPIRWPWPSLSLQIEKSDQLVYSLGIVIPFTSACKDMCNLTSFI